MKFKNNTDERIKFCLSQEERNAWVTVRPGESVDLKDEERAMIWGLEKCEIKAVKSSIGSSKVETKKLKKSKKRSK